LLRKPKTAKDQAHHSPREAPHSIRVLCNLPLLDGYVSPLLWLEFGKDAKWQSGYDSGHSTRTLLGPWVTAETFSTSAGVLSSRRRDY
jgi:hypothetical protein